MSTTPRGSDAENGFMSTRRFQLIHPVSPTAGTRKVCAVQPLHD